MGSFPIHTYIKVSNLIFFETEACRSLTHVRSMISCSSTASVVRFGITTSVFHTSCVAPRQWTRFYCDMLAHGVRKQSGEFKEVTFFSESLSEVSKGRN